MKLKVQKKDGPLFASDIAQLERHLAAGGKERIILAGDLVLCSLESLKPGAQHVAQLPRPVSRALPLNRGASATLKVALDKDAQSKLVKKRRKPVFAVDAMLRYGQRVKNIDELAVIGVFEATQSTQVLVLFFKKGTLSALTEYSLCAVSSHTFDADLHHLLERIRLAQPQMSYHWCSGRAAPSSHEFVTAPALVWQQAPVQTLTMSGNPGFIRVHGLSVAIALLSVAGYGAALYLPYTGYLKARDALSLESSQLKGQFSFDAERLSLLRDRSAFFETQRKAAERLNALNVVLESLADETDLVVQEAHVTSPLDLARRPAPGASKLEDFEIVVSVPRQPEMTALAQSKPLLQSLSANMSMSLRLATGDAYHDVDKAGSPDGKPRRLYRIQGDFRNAP